jgi:hypothetical protein
LGKLIAKMGWLCVPLVLLFVAGYAIERYAPWQSPQNPRTKILWGGEYDGSPVVILGSSTFNSSRINTADQAIWSRLAALSGEKVFSGSLDGAQTVDVLSAARLVAASWPAGSTVFVDVPPSKFVNKTKTSSTDTGNYASRFANLLQVDNPKHTPSVYLGNALQPLAARFFLYRNVTEMGLYLRNMVSPSRALLDLHNARVWTQDDLAAQLFVNFSASLKGGYREPYDRYFGGLHQILAAKNIRLVFVLTPLNRELIRRYSGDGGASMLGMFDANRAELKQYMAARKLDYLDLTDAVEPQCFADMVHTNVCGDDAIAMQLNEWLRSHR